MYLIFVSKIPLSKSVVRIKEDLCCWSSKNIRDDLCSWTKAGESSNNIKHMFGRNIDNTLYIFDMSLVSNKNLPLGSSVDVRAYNFHEDI